MGSWTSAFRGDVFACSVSAIVIYPVDQGRSRARKFLNYVVGKRRFFFDNYFHRVLHKATGDPLAPTDAETKRGYVVFTRDYMQDVFYNDTPLRAEIDQAVTGFGFADEYEPLTVAICPLADLGKVTCTVSDLVGPGTIAAKNIAVGYASNRLTRVSADGAVYTIAPRMLIPRSAIDVPKGNTRRFWLTVQPPADAAPGLYKGQITITPTHGQAARVPVEYQRLSGHARRRRRAGRSLELRDQHPLGRQRSGDQGLERPDGRAQPAEDARLRIHHVLGHAQDAVPGLQGRQTGIRFQRSRPANGTGPARADSTCPSSPIRNSRA